MKRQGSKIVSKLTSQDSNLQNKSQIESQVIASSTKSNNFSSKSQKSIKNMKLEVKNREKSKIALSIGIDYELEKEKYDNLLERFLSYDLPENWTRKTDPKGNPIYFNNLTKNNTKNHPLSKKFKQIFLEILINDQKHKQKPENSKKTENDIFGHSRQKSYNKSNTLTRRLAIDVNELSTNYSESLTRLEERKLKDADLSNKPDIRRSLLLMALRFYETNFGFPLKEIPKAIIFSEDYLMVEPEKLAQALSLLNIRYGELHLYKYGRLLLGLPLPPCWSQNLQEETQEVVYWYKDEFFMRMPPSYNYVRDLIKFWKNKYKEPEVRPNEGIIPFKNSIGRYFTINFREYYQLLLEGRLQSQHHDLWHKCDIKVYSSLSDLRSDKNGKHNLKISPKDDLYHKYWNPDEEIQNLSKFSF